MPIRQRAQEVNAPCGYPTGFGPVALKDAAKLSRLIVIIEVPANGLPEHAVKTLRVLLKVIAGSDAEIAKLE